MKFLNRPGRHDRARRHVGHRPPRRMSEPKITKESRELPVLARPHDEMPVLDMMHQRATEPDIFRGPSGNVAERRKVFVLRNSRSGLGAIGDMVDHPPGATLADLALPQVN